MKNSMKKTVWPIALGGICAVAVAACGQPPPENAASAGGPGGADFQACMVTDSGGIDDRSFNESAWEGLQQAEAELGIESTVVESTTETDFTPNVQQMVAADCGLVVTVGFLLGDATAAAATANPDERFAIVDFAHEEPIENVKPLMFDTAQASFLAGYLAAGTTTTGTVATFGGLNIPTVSIFMDGFAAGVEHHNQVKGTTVQVLGWDPATQNGSFTGDFQNQANGQNLANTFIQQGADIIMPVAGPVGLGAAAAAQEAGDVALIWVDTDGYESASQYAPLFLTSVVKEIDNAVLETTRQTVDGAFSGEPYVGTLANEGVSLAPYHDFADDVPVELQAEVEQLHRQIVDGTLSVPSPSSPAAS
ncbi:BMP family lipoprotein [Pseudonocardia nigra]|uniref:BMP family lipoprotein n=1 Tax=Pseudonocardia nigra TaxID=1921578 RepID=UPI001C5ED18A|nr:BMP family ABC transporter substrate-binding protein [Pseudonocardia nigra]